jgi:hypothetical protein
VFPWKLMMIVVVFLRFMPVPNINNGHRWVFKIRRCRVATLDGDIVCCDQKRAGEKLILVGAARMRDDFGKFKMAWHVWCKVHGLTRRASHLQYIWRRIRICGFMRP